MDPSRATSYQPLTEPVVGIELANVKTPSDAVAFVRRFGLLKKSERLGDATSVKYDAQRGELFTDFQDAAKELQYILMLTLEVRRGNQGDADAISRLREHMVIPEDTELCSWSMGVKEVLGRAGDLYSPEERFEGVDNRTLLMGVSQKAADKLNDGLAGDNAAPYVFDRAFIGESVCPGAWRLGVAPTTLEGVCYLTVALMLAEKEPIEVCRELTCGHFFVATDGRQKFCTPACGNRARYRRYQEKAAKAKNSEPM